MKFVLERLFTMSVFSKLWKMILRTEQKNTREAYLCVYVQIVKQARQKALYEIIGIKDDFDGRFEALVLHMILVLHRLQKEEQTQRRTVGQELFNIFFSDMDQVLREMGVGDLSVSKKIKKMAEAFYGRLDAYNKAFSSAKDQNIIDCVQRNFFPNEVTDKVENTVKRLAFYVVEMLQYLEEKPSEDILSENIFLNAPQISSKY